MSVSGGRQLVRAVLVLAERAMDDLIRRDAGSVM